MRIKKGDTVSVVAGKEKGKKGQVLSTAPSKNRVVVEGVNMMKRHAKPTQKSQQAGIIQREAPIHISNVRLICPNCGKPVKVGVHQKADDARTRYCKLCELDID